MLRPENRPAVAPTRAYQTARNGKGPALGDTILVAVQVGHLPFMFSPGLVHRNAFSLGLGDSVDGYSGVHSVSQVQ